MVSLEVESDVLEKHWTTRCVTGSKFDIRSGCIDRRHTDDAIRRCIPAWDLSRTAEPTVASIYCWVMGSPVVMMSRGLETKFNLKRLGRPAVNVNAKFIRQFWAHTSWLKHGSTLVSSQKTQQEQQQKEQLNGTPPTHLVRFSAPNIIDSDRLIG